jgi:hypothetical protein
MPIQNISAVFTPTQLGDLKTAIAAIAPLFPILVTLTETERKSLQRVGPGRQAFCETAINGAAVFATVVPVFMNKVEWDKDETYAGQLVELVPLIEALLQQVLDTLAAVGAERYRQSRKFYEAVKAAREDVPGLQSLYETLSEQFDGQSNSHDGEGESSSSSGEPDENP